MSNIVDILLTMLRIPVDRLIYYSDKNSTVYANPTRFLLILKKTTYDINK